MAKADLALMRAFVAGAKWWEHHKTNATMWQSDQRLAVLTAQMRAAAGTLGKPEPGTEKAAPVDCEKHNAAPGCDTTPDVV